MKSAFGKLETYLELQKLKKKCDISISELINSILIQTEV